MKAFKRLTVSLKQKDVEMIDFLSEHEQESGASILRKSLNYYFKNSKKNFSKEKHSEEFI